MRILALLPLVASLAFAEGQCPDFAPQKRAYFGDLHVHTTYSFDALDYGTRSDPTLAYAFARGGAIDVASGAVPAIGQTPGPFGVRNSASGGNLDFMTVTDHAEFLGTVHGCTINPVSGFYDDPYCVALRGAPNPDFQNPTAPNYVVKSPCLGLAPTTTTAEACRVETTSAWQEEQQAASAANTPCTFTTFNAFEWSGVNIEVQGYPTLHRNVFFANEHVPALPIDFVVYRGIQLLWEALETQCRAEDGCEAIAIPHNSNQSRGGMFDTTGFDAVDFDRMARYQRLAELHQHKGNSECLTDTSDSGEVRNCTFEIETGDDGPESVPAYLRPAVERGLEFWSETRTNPLMLGFVGATDTHNATGGNVGETAWPGNSGINDNTTELRLTGIGGQNPGGITGIWAEENTRPALWAALMRRETFATSGPRIRVRFYAFRGTADPCADPDFPNQVLAAGGVPMGGTIGEGDGPPRFVVYALPDATPLQAVDLVRATVVAGERVEKITTIPFAGAPYCVTWTEPDFDAAAPALWYARVRQQPTPRWSHYDCERLRASNPGGWKSVAPGCASTDPDAGGLDVTIEERAWTSPIWYQPGALVTVASPLVRLRAGARAAQPTVRRWRWVAASAPGGLRIVPPARGAAGDPSRTGATLTIYNAGGGTEVAAVSLAPGGWRANRSGKRWRWRTRDASLGVRGVTIGADRLVVEGRGLPFTLDEPKQGRVALRLAVAGGALWCGAVDGSVDVPRKFQGSGPAPALCPVALPVP